MTATVETTPKTEQSDADEGKAGRALAPVEGVAKRIARHYCSTPEAARSFGLELANELFRIHGMFAHDKLDAVREAMTPPRAGASTPNANPFAALLPMLAGAMTGR